MSGMRGRRGSVLLPLFGYCNKEPPPFASRAGKAEVELNCGGNHIHDRFKKKQQ